MGAKHQNGLVSGALDIPTSSASWGYDEQNHLSLAHCSRDYQRPPCLHLSTWSVQVEQEEEYITNTLMKRLKEAKDEKAKIAIEVENEEEYLVNNLQKRLQTVYAEKVDLEMQLQIEQDAEAKLKHSVRCFFHVPQFPPPSVYVLIIDASQTTMQAPEAAISNQQICVLLS